MMTRGTRSVVIAGLTLPLLGCATSPSEMRTATVPVQVQTSRSFDAFAGCIADRVITKFKMTSFPTERGTSFVYDFGNQGMTKAGMLVDVIKGPPVSAEVSIKGGPWLGRDKLLLNAVRGCATA